MSEKASIRLELNADEKEDWRQHAKEEHGNNLSRLIKESVRKEMSDQWVHQSDVPDNPDVDVDLEPLEDGIADVRREVESLRREIGGSQISDEGESEEVIELAVELSELLPLVESADKLVDLPDEIGDLDDSDRPVGVQTMSPEEYVQLSGRPKLLADYLDEDETQVRRSLLWLEQERSEIESLTDEYGYRRYYELK